MIDPTNLLKKIVSNNVYIYTVVYPGIDFGCDWVDLTEEEALFLRNLQGDINGS